MIKIQGIVTVVLSGLLPSIAVYAQDQIFSDVPSSAPYFSVANQLYLRGVSNGTSTSPLTFSPSGTLARDQMAALIIRAVYTAKNGNAESFSYTPTAWFTDVSNDPNSL